MNLKQKLNNVFKENPNFIFYDYENECVGMDLLDFILKEKKIQRDEIISEIIEDLTWFGGKKVDIVETITKWTELKEKYKSKLK